VSAVVVSEQPTCKEKNSRYVKHNISSPDQIGDNTYIYIMQRDIPSSTSNTLPSGHMRSARLIMSAAREIFENFYSPHQNKAQIYNDLLKFTL
jgi:hypothetical protein